MIPLLKNLHRLPASQHLIFKTALLVCKTLNGDDPAYLQDFLKPYACGREGMRWAVDTAHLHFPSTWYTPNGDRDFSVFGPKVWNSLPPDVQLSPSVSSIKTVKAHLLGIACTKWQFSETVCPKILINFQISCAHVFVSVCVFIWLCTLMTVCVCLYVCVCLSCYFDLWCFRGLFNIHNCSFLVMCHR